MPRIDPATREGRRLEELVLIQYWDKDEIPDYLTAELATFTELNPDFRHLVFSRAAAEEFIAEHFGAREVAAFRCCAVPSMQADYFRFCVGIVFEGGLFSDVDFRCFAPIDPLIPEPGRIRLFQEPQGNLISGFYAFRSPGHPFLELSLEIITANIERRFPDTVYFATGPPIVTALYVLHRMGSRDGSVDALEDPPLKRAIRSYWEVIADYDRVTAAFEGVEIRPSTEYHERVEPTGFLPYKGTDDHWLNAKGDIFKPR